MSLGSLSAELLLCLAIVPPLQVSPVLLAQTSQSWWGRCESPVWQTGRQALQTGAAGKLVKRCPLYLHLLLYNWRGFKQYLFTLVCVSVCSFLIPNMCFCGTDYIVGNVSQVDHCRLVVGVSCSHICNCVQTTVTWPPQSDPPLCYRLPSRWETDSFSAFMVVFVLQDDRNPRTVPAWREGGVFCSASSWQRVSTATRLRRQVGVIMLLRLNIPARKGSCAAIPTNYIITKPP